MLSGFEFTLTNFLRLFTLIRYERARRTCNYRQAVQCFTRDVYYWEMEHDGFSEIHARGRSELEASFRNSDERFQLLRVVGSGTEWAGDEMRSHWHAVLRKVGNGETWGMSGFSRFQFRGRLIQEMVTVVTAVNEPVKTEA